MKNRCLFAAVFSSILGMARVHATVQVPELLDDHMVLQQKSPVVLWGWGTKPGEPVVVTTSWGETVETKVDPQAHWSVTIHTPAATPLKDGLKPQHIEIVAPKENQVQLRDVLIGEVWLCSGQSNMVMPCGPGYPKGWCAWFGEATWNEDKAKANRPGLRLFNVQQAVGSEPREDCKGVIPGVGVLAPDADGIVPPPARGWQPCTPEVAAGFSAVAYHFGAALQDRLGIPVGVIVSAYGGTSIAPWISLDGVAPFNGGKPPKGEASMGKGGGLYNGMIAPVLPLRLAGFCWYQGESNVGMSGEDYARLLRALIADWRRGAENQALSFYYVQIAPCAHTPPDASGELRAGQALVQDDPGVGMAVINDLGEPKGIHPKRKREVGERLARLALVRTYGCTDIAADAPRATAAKAQGGKIRILFQHAEGLRTRDGQPPTCFEVAAEDGHFIPAPASIEGTAVVVTCPAVARPAAVRFAWGADAIPNLVAASGLPAAQFKLPVNP